MSRRTDSRPPERSDLNRIATAWIAAALIASSLLFLVAVRGEQVRVGYRVHDLRTELVRLKQDRAALEVERASLMRPSRLNEVAAKLGLVAVDGTRVVKP